jgi:hypothetical protein
MARAAGEISVGRKIGATGAMAAVSGIVGALALRHGYVDWLIAASAGVLGLAAVGLTRRSLVVQVLSRGAAWVVLCPTLIEALSRFVRGSTPGLAVAGLAASSAAALLLARPMLHTSNARMAFAPKVYRRWFLAGSTASASAAFIVGGIAFAIARREPASAMAFALLATSLFASSLGVVRMRGWGILLGAVTSIVLLVAPTALHVHVGASIALAFVAAPALVLHLLPVLVARMTGAATAPQLRIDAGVGAGEASIEGPTRIRVGEPKGDEVELDAPSTEARAAAALRV